MLLERESEQETLWAVVEDALDGRGGMAIVEGDAGIGKTSLLEHTAARAEDAGARVLRARGTILEREFGFGIVRQLFERTLVGAEQGDRDELLTGAASAARPAIGLGPGSDAPAGDDPALEVQHGLYWVAANLAERGPLVLLVDDAQWADLPSLHWVSYLAGRLDGVALAALVAWSTGEPGAPTELFEELRAVPAVRELVPAPLSEAATATLVRDALGGEEGHEVLSQACHEITRGNPFLVSALVESLPGALDAPTSDTPRDAGEPGPAAVQRFVLLRLARLGDEATALARAVSLLDTDAEPRFAYELADLDADAGARAAGLLDEARIVEPGATLRFAHPILRTAVYESIPAAERAMAHRRAAVILAERGGDTDRAGVHLLATHPDGEPWTLYTLMGASERARSRGAPEMALTLLERALEEPAPVGARAELLLAAGELALMLARPDAKRYLAAAHAEAVDPAMQGAAAAEFAQATIHARPEEGAAVLRGTLGRLSPGERERADRLRLALLTVETTGGLRAPREIEKELRALHEAASLRSASRLAAACVLVWHQELWEESPSANTVADLARQLTDVRPLIDAYGADFLPLTWAASVLADWDQVAVADAAFDAVLDSAGRTQNAFATTLAASSRGIHSALRGDFSRAEADARAALDSARLSGSWVGRRGAVLALIWALTGRGEYEELDAVLAEHGLERDAGSSRAVDGNLLIARATLRCCQARAGEACDDAARAIDLVSSPNPLSRINIWAPRALAAGGQSDAARGLAIRAVDAARAGGFETKLAFALHSAGLAEDGERSIALHSEAVQILERTPWRWERAEALVDLGAALRRMNRRRDARPPLRKGFALAERIGAVALAERARAELVATGARPRRVTRGGVDALTPSERRVADMAAKGMTIAEVAQALVVTRKTVETHLYSAYRKLDVSSRDELAAALD